MAYDLKTPEDVLRTIKDDKIAMIDLRFTDVPGLWQHFSVPPSALDSDSFEDGVGFDGSSIRGFQEIQESDMLVIPDPTSAFLDPFTEAPTLVLICNIRDPVTGQAYSRDARYIAQKAEAYLRSTRIGDTAYFGPELEHFVFNQVRYDQSTNYGYYEIDAVEANWSAARREGPGLGHILRPKEGYFPVPPADVLQDARTEMVSTLENIGIRVEAHHHEVATGGQGEIDMRFAPLTRMADNVMIYKYVVKNVARKRGMTATFMPKPLFGDNGSGMHVHQSIWQSERPLFAGEGYAGSSETMLHYIGGLLKHAPALLAICAPTVNSYRRLVPAFEAMLMAGLDGIQGHMHPGDPIDKNLYDLPPEELAKVPSAPGSLEDALDALEHDHAFMLKGDVFTPDVVKTHLGYKRAREVDEMRLRPHPYEFFLYYDV